MATIENPRTSRDFVHDATGAEVPDPGKFLERGVNSPFPATPVEYNSDLFPRTIALQTYEKMKRNDAQIRAMLKAMKIPVLGGDWYIEPASTGDVEEQENKDAAEFVQWNLFEGMTIAWQQVLHHALTMLDYGSSVFETVYEVQGWRPARDNANSRNFACLRKLAPRPAVTIGRFLYDQDGGPAGVEHAIVDPTESNTGMYFTEEQLVTIPIDDLLIFTFDQEGGNLEGMSVLRTAYQHWYYKTNLYKIDAIQKERHGIGIPDIELPPGYDDNDLKYAANLGRNLRTNERSYILRPQGWIVGFAKVEGQLTDALRSAEHHDMMIARNVLASFINATGGSSGSGSGGSRSSSAVALDLFLKSLRGIGNLICDIMNKHLIPELVDYNFTVTRYPKLKVRGIGESRPQQELSSALRNLAQVNAITFDDDTEKYLRDVFDMPTTWDKDSARVNEELLKPFTDPSGIPVKTAAQARGNAGASPSGNAPPSGTKPAGRGPTTGNVPKGTTEG